MPEVHRTDRAEVDLVEILDYLARHSRRAFQRFADQLERAASQHARFPLMGRSFEHLLPGMRRFLVGNYSVFYQPTPTGILILRVIHHARDLGTIFPGEADWPEAGEQPGEGT
jgi:toxin ParE1/3/4